MGSSGIETPQNRFHIPLAEKLSEESKSHCRKLLKGLFVDPPPNGYLQLGSPLPASRSFRPFRRVDGMQQQQHRRTPAGGSRQVEREQRRGVIRGRRPLVARLTEDIVSTFIVCNPYFRLPKPQKWYLTRPSQGVRNGGLDNENHDLILYHNCVLVDPASKVRFQVKNRLGNGAYGQACRCSTSDSRYPDFVAVKIIKNDPIYSIQAQYEVGICKWLNEKDPQDKHHIYRILYHFNYAGHKCLVFEILGMNLYELLRENLLRGLPTDDVQGFTRQILEALVAMGNAGVIHRDLKPENVLLLPDPSQIKVIDFGSACMVLNMDSLNYIQSRFYRSPEVLLQLPYTTAIDMWSLGCVAAELFLGRPLFPAGCPYDLFRFMIDVLGSQPPDNMIDDSKEKCKPEFFKVVSSAPLPGIIGTDERSPAFRLLSEDEFEAGAKRRPQVGKRPFGDKNLEEMITGHQINTATGGVEKEMKSRESFIHFLKGVLNFDPVKRWTPQQALQHPFITGENLAEWQSPREKIQSYNGNGKALKHSPAVGGSPQMHFSATACHPGLHASPDFLKYMLTCASNGPGMGSKYIHSSASNGPGMGSSSGSMVGSPGQGSSFRGSAESTGIYHVYSNSPGTVVNGHHHFAGGYAFSPDTYLHDMYSFHNGQPVNVRPPNNQSGFLGGIPAPSYQLNTIYGCPASSSDPSSYKSNASSFHSSPFWSVASHSSISYSSPSSQSQFSPQSQVLISPNWLEPTFPATVIPGNSVMRRFSPRSHYELLRNQHPGNRNLSVMSDGVLRHPSIRNAPGASRTAHPSSSTTGNRVGPLPRVNQTLYSYLSEGSEELLFSPDLGQWRPRNSSELLFGDPGVASSSKGFTPDRGQRHPTHSGESLFGDPCQASTSKGRSEAGLLFSPDLGQRHPRNNGEQLFGDPGKVSPSKGRSVPEASTGKSGLPYSSKVPGHAGEAPSSKGKRVRQNLTGKSRFDNRAPSSNAKQLVSYSTMVAGGAVASPSSGKDLSLSYSTMVAGDEKEMSISNTRGANEQSSGISRLQTAIFRNLSLAKRSSVDTGEASSSSGRAVSEHSGGIPRNLSYSNMVGGHQLEESTTLSGQSKPQSLAEETGQSRSKVEVQRHPKR